MESIKSLNKLLNSYPKNSGFLIAYSGGVDSTALLHLLGNNFNTRAIHINHGLQTEANNWQQHCQNTCQQLNIPLIVEQAQLIDSSEDSCRKARYTFFKKHLNKNEILLTAHHSQDQAETVLLKLLRGTGLKGVTGIESFSTFAKGYLGRPLLSYSPQQLKKYLLENNFNWIEDSSNTNNQYRRNHIRNLTLPSLVGLWPQAINNIVRSANNNKQSLDLLLHLLDFNPKYLTIEKLQNNPHELRTTMLYHWLSAKNMPLPDKPALDQLTTDFISAKADKSPHYHNKFYQLFRWQQAIYCIKNFDRLDESMSFHWNTKDTFKLPNGCGHLTFLGKEKMDLIVKFNQKGEKITTHQHSFNKSIKKLYQNHKIPIWQKLNTPFIYHDQQLVSLGYDWSHINLFKELIKFSPENLIVETF